MVRRFSVLMLALVLLAACGGQPATIQPTTAPAAAAPTSAPAEAAPTTAPAAAEPTTAPVTDEPTTAPAATSETTTGAGTFPVTIEHKFGSTTIPAAPERIISLGFTDQDAIIALGYKPVAVREFFGNQPNAIWPWAREALGDAKPEVINMPFGDLNFEALAAYRPDLIIGVSSGITEDEYKTLTEIAPTLAQSDDYVDFGVPWQEQTVVIGRALGLEAEAQTLVDETEALFAQVVAEHPEFNGATASIASPANDGQYFFSGPQHERQRFLTALGFVLPEELATLAGDSFYGTISGEQMTMLDTDVLIWTVTADQQKTIEANPIYQQLTAAKEGRSIFLDTTTGADLGGAGIVFGSILSIPVALENLVPRLSAAVDGDPTTNGAVSAPAPAEETATTETTTSMDSAFPLTIEHKFGSTEIAKVPERIVTVGLTDHDALLALGVVPVGTTEWFGAYPSAIWPWAQDKVGDAKPVVVGDSSAPNFENIAALKPDLILALYAGVTEDQYKLLTQIAPTVAQPADYVDYGIPWQEQTRTIGRIVGKAAEADAMVKAVEDRFAQVRTEHPEFEGATSIVATPYEGIWVYGPEDVRGRFLTMLGFRLPDGLAEVTGTEFGGNLSMERADLLNVDVIIWLDAADAQGPLGGPVYASLPVHTEGREVHLSSYDDPLGGATSFVSVLSLPYLLDGIVPRMAAAIDGDTNTLVPVSPTATP